ncbi:MAG: DUF2169 domain-containing protein [Gammaproteobacteria bacterium]|nr:DUF2169 domain-containing protein [Gammaproteobacteria bacterium]
MAYKGLENSTDFAAELALLADENGRDLMLVMVKATYSISETGHLQLIEEQIPVNLAGEYYGEAGKTSLKYAPEANFAKLSTDIALIGSACAPNGAAVIQIDVGLRVGSMSKGLRVFGDRIWMRSSNRIYAGWSMSKPQAFTSMPLIYERAFGGVDLSPENEQERISEPGNLVGTGIIAKKSRLEKVCLPNIEDPKQLIKSPQDRPQPTGFGFISPEWQPRQSYAGTYDKAWQDSRMPLLPQDFDRRFFNAAHPDLISPGFLIGTEPVDIINASPRGRLQFNLPGNAPIIKVAMVYEEPLTLETQLDSVIINTDDHIVQLLWRGSLDVYNRIYDLEKIETLINHENPQNSSVAA